jgi:hypothetical protein
MLCSSTRTKRNKHFREREREREAEKKAEKLRKKNCRQKAKIS